MGRRKQHELFDAKRRRVPGRMEQEFLKAKALRHASRALSNMYLAVLKASTQYDPIVRRGLLKSLVELAKRELEDCRPWVVCANCSASRSRCEHCSGRGWMTRHELEAYEKHVESQGLPAEGG